MAETVRGSRRANSNTTLTNAISFLVEQTIKERVNTSEVVSVVSSDKQGNTSKGGKLKATPLVQNIDGFNKVVKNAPISAMPFYRPQAGKCAIIMEPQPGDKALAIFTKHDSSNLEAGKSDPVQPGSFRTFDQADGFLVNGILGEEPEVWLMLDPPTGNIELSTKSANIEISCRESGEMVIKSPSGTVTIEAPNITIKGNVMLQGSLTVTGDTEFQGGQLTVNGNELVKGSLTANNGVTDVDVRLKTHLHTGVEPGGGTTAVPVPGS